MENNGNSCAIYVTLLITKTSPLPPQVNIAMWLCCNLAEWFIYTEAVSKSRKCTGCTHAPAGSMVCQNWAKISSPNSYKHLLGLQRIRGNSGRLSSNPDDLDTHYSSSHSHSSEWTQGLEEDWQVPVVRIQSPSSRVHRLEVLCLN